MNIPCLINLMAFLISFVSLTLSLSSIFLGTEHYGVARGVQKILQDYKSLQDIIAILGELSIFLIIHPIRVLQSYQVEQESLIQSRYGRVVRRRQANSCPCTKDPTIPVPALPSR